MYHLCLVCKQVLEFYPYFPHLKYNKTFRKGLKLADLESPIQPY